MNYTKILDNELIWLESLNCIIKENKNNIIVKNKYLISEDFNFIHSTTDENIKEIISVMKDNNIFHFRTTSNLLTSEALQLEKSFDTNYTGFSSIKNIQNLLNKKNDLHMDKDIKWKTILPKNRFFSEKILPYSIIYKKNIIGQICFIYHKDIIGLYDFEIYEQFKNLGYASLFFNELLTSIESDYQVFIQTWSENLVANKLYSKVKFSKLSDYYYYKLLLKQV